VNIAAQLIAADIIRGAGMGDYFNKDNGVYTSIKDAKLHGPLAIAKRLVELGQERN
jgi:hypothetical protein